MQARISRRAAAIRSQWDDSVHHDLSGVAMMTSLEQKPGDDELERLRERTLVVFQELKPRLRGMIEKRISPRLKGRVDVEGVFQNALSGLLKSLESKQPKSDAELCAWIFKRTWSRWQDELRRWSRRARDIVREEPLPSGSDVALVGGIGVATNFGLKETVERIREALKPIDFQIVELRIVDELPYEELATFLNFTPEAVRKRFTRALLKIRQVVSSPFSSS
jgi:RNA polymerase sigma factor (sigma-70 family)